MKRILGFRFYPFLFTSYPALHLLAANINQVYFSVVYRPLITSLLLTAAGFFTLKWILRDGAKAALVISLVVFWFFSYGHVLYLLRGVQFGDTILGRHRFLAVPYFLLLVVAIWFVLRTKQNITNLTPAFNLFGLGMVLLAVGQLGFYFLHTSLSAAELRSKARGIQTINRGNLPDLYIIVLDSYARADVLKNTFGYDNQPFLRQLRDMGFYVADCSRSNYNSTDLSLASSFNLDYLQPFGNDLGAGGLDEAGLSVLLSENKVRRTLEALGYKTITFDNGLSFAKWREVDVFYSPPKDTGLFPGLSPFELMALRSTAASILLDMKVIYSNAWLRTVEFPYQDHIDQVRFTLDSLDNLPYTAEPKLVYAHLNIPHKPLVFDAQGNIQTDRGFFGNNGDAVDKSYFQRGYVDEVRYINQQIIPIVRNIIKQSQRQPIVVLVGDHGYYWDQTNFENLEALYLPNGGEEGLYPAISLVNIFRLIMDRYYGADYPLLVDESYAKNLDAPSFDIVEQRNLDCRK